MNKKPLIFLLAAFTLAGCAKTNLLYGENAYNSPVFDENYYTDWDHVDELANKIQSTKTKILTSPSFNCSADLGKVDVAGGYGKNYNWGGDKEKQFGYNNNLSKIEKEFNYGITSKLFDGRVRCESLYQKSRVQVNKTGFAMFFPKLLVSTKYLGFACRGGTDYPAGQEFAYSDLEVNFTWSFYIHLDNGMYHKVEHKIQGAKIPVDNGGNTAFVNFLPMYEEELQGAAAMSFEWECVDAAKMSTRPELTDDYKSKDKTKKHHLALMLYEIFIGESVWH